MHGIGKRFVYILRSEFDRDRHYVGVTSDVDARLEWHNHGPCGYTIENRPWSGRRLDRVPDRTGRPSLREVLEIRIRARVLEAAFQSVWMTAPFSSVFPSLSLCRF